LLIITLTQLYPINRNFTGSHYNKIAKLKAVPHGRCHSAHPHDGIQYDSLAPAGTSALSASQTPCHASGGSLSRPYTPHRGTRQQQQLSHVAAACKGSKGEWMSASPL